MGLRETDWEPLPPGDGIRKGQERNKRKGTMILSSSRKLIDGTTARSERPISHGVRKLAYHHIHQYHRRQYLLRQVAIEFFDTDGVNLLYAFANQTVSPFRLMFLTYIRCIYTYIVLPPSLTCT